MKENCPLCVKKFDDLNKHLKSHEYCFVCKAFVNDLEKHENSDVHKKWVSRKKFCKCCDVWVCNFFFQKHNLTKKHLKCKDSGCKAKQTKRTYNFKCICN